MNKTKILHLTAHDEACLCQARTILLSDLSANHTLQALARKSGLNRYKLTYGFKQLFGTTVYTFLHNARMQHAQQLLRTDRSIKDIAGLCGYSSQQNFTTAFRKNFGYTPASLQKAYRKAAAAD